MKYNNEIKYRECFENLINSIQHFEDYTEIDKRTYFITINTINDYNRQKTKKVIYSTMNRLMTGSRYDDSSDRPSLILSDDVESTRVKHTVTDKPILPHFHGVLVLSKNSMSKFKNDEDLFQQVETAIASIREVKKCKVEAYYYKTTILNTIDYAAKIRNKHISTNTDFFDFIVYPYQSDIKHKSGKLFWSAPKDMAQKLSDEVLSNPTKIFSKEYLDKFGTNLISASKYGSGSTVH